MKLFFGFARQAFVASAMYRLEFWMDLMGNFVRMYGAYWLWTTLYLVSPQLFTTSLEQMLTYAMLAQSLDVILSATNLPRYYISRQMHDGAIQMDLLRPLDFTFHLLARSAGELFFNLAAQGLPGFLFGALFLSLRPPASPLYALLFAISLALAFLVGFAMNYLLGLVAIYTLATRRISWVYFAMQSFLSGGMVPLWYFPPLLAQIAALLPFQAVIGIPLSIYIGRLPLNEALSALGLQAMWAAALLGLGLWVWDRAQNRLIVQGG
jgi:ABC-2 type transport system permease protein